MKQTVMVVWLIIVLDITGSTVSDETPWLYYSDGTVIRRWNLKTQAIHTVINETRDNGTTKALDFDIMEGKLFWTDDKRELIQSGTLSSSGIITEITTVTRGVASEGVAVDWIFKHLYWTDTSGPAIAVSDYRGQYIKTLIASDIDLPRAIVVDPATRYLFWSDWGDVEKIERLRLDGEERLVLISDDIFMPTGMAIDYSSSRLYWADAYFGHIKSCNQDGGEVKTVLSDQSGFVSFPFGLAINKDLMFFTDWSNGTLRYFNVTSGSQQNVTALRASMGVQWYDGSRQLDSGSFWASLCSCDYLCLPVTRNASCFTIACVCPDSVSCNKTFVTNCTSDQSSDTSSSDGWIIGCVVGALLLVISIISITLIIKHAVKRAAIKIKPGLSNSIAKDTAKCESNEPNGAKDGPMDGAMDGTISRPMDGTMDVDIRVLGEVTKQCEPCDAPKVNEHNETAHGHLPSNTIYGSTSGDTTDTIRVVHGGTKHLDSACTR